MHRYRKPRWLSGRVEYFKFPIEILNMKIDHKLAEFLGILVGDGFLSYTPRTIALGVVCNPEEREYLTRHVVVIFEEIFGVDYNITERERALRLRAYSDKFEEIIDLGIGAGKKKPKIPKKIKKDLEYVKDFLRGIFDTDGCIFWDERKIYKKPYPRIQITTTSSKFSKEIEKALKDLDFKPTRRERDKNGYLGTSFCCEVELYGFENLDKWKTKIGSNHPNKNKKLSASVA